MSFCQNDLKEFSLQHLKLTEGFLCLNLPSLLLSSNNKSHLPGDTSVLKAWLFLLCNLEISVLLSSSEKSLPLEVHIMSSASLEFSAAANPIKKNCKVLDCYANMILLNLNVLKIKLLFLNWKKKNQFCHQALDINTGTWTHTYFLYIPALFSFWFSTINANASFYTMSLSISPSAERGQAMPVWHTVLYIQS